MSLYTTMRQRETGNGIAFWNIQAYPSNMLPTTRLGIPTFPKSSTNWNQGLKYMNLCGTFIFKLPHSAFAPQPCDVSYFICQDPL